VPRIAVIPGDGIGVDVVREGCKVLRAVAEATRLDLKLDEFDFGAERYLRDKTTLPDETLARFVREYDAVYLGALGDPRIPDMAHARDILLRMRFELDLYVNFRPVKLLDERLCPVKGKKREDVDMVIFRENTEGLYVGMGGNFKKGTPDEVAINEDVNTRKGVERIIRHAFEWARANGKTRVTMSDKNNVLRYAHDLWDRAFREIAREYPSIESEHLFVDALCMQLVKQPEHFQVIVTCNMFGDIITDLGAALQGGLGMAASGNIHPGRLSLFEPVHGSAPKYAGKDVANPVGAILTAALMLRHLGHEEPARRIDDAVTEAVLGGVSTRDLGGTHGTAAVGDWIAKRVARASA
jgi:3-isopropylmalate dehydrogenase